MSTEIKVARGNGVKTTRKTAQRGVIFEKFRKEGVC